MTLNHLNLVVTDVVAASQFFETHFDFKCIKVKGDNAIAILEGKNNFILVFMAGKDGNAAYPKDFHVGFMLPNATAVDEVFEKLKLSNIEVGNGAGKIRDTYGFYFHFDTLLIEVGTYSI